MLLTAHVPDRADRCSVMPVHEKVLIVEDNALVALGLREVLSDVGFEVVGTAATMSEALRLGEHARPDIAIADIRIAGQHDGIETAVELQQRSGVPVLFLTATNDTATRLRTTAAEPAGYLVKPVDAEHLVRAVGLALTSHSSATGSAKRHEKGQ